MSDRIRLQPEPIGVPDEDPFANDLLGRRKFVEAFAGTLRGIEPPAVFAIDGPWGTGKTTFVRMLAAHLGNQDVKVVTINAWETDYVENPLAALAAAFLKETEDADPTSRHKFKKTAIAALRATAPAAIRIVSASLGLPPTAANELGSLLAKAAENRLDGFREDADSIDAFRNNLRELAAATSDQPVVLIVDELDRCRPDYAVQALEVIKHLFDVDNVLFVLAVNRSQLDESVRTLYGTPKDLESYFRRFFDVELRLPPGDREGYMERWLRQLNPNHVDPRGEILAKFLPKSDYGVRAIEQTMRHFNLVRSSLTEAENDIWGYMLQTAFLLRLVDQDGYRAFVRGDISDATLADQVFEQPWARPLRSTLEGNLIEVTLMVGAEGGRREGRTGPSELLSKYRSEAEKGGPVTVQRGPLRLYEAQNRVSGSGRFWQVLTERIEMLATTR